MSTASLDRVEAFVARNARPLDAARFQHHLRDGPVEDVLQELARFQNEDGGYGHGLESDLRLPESSPICTWVGLSLLRELGIEGSSDLVQRALAYLTTTYSARAHGWPPVDEKVNEHPHAIWFHFDAEKGGTSIHETPWNPTAALLGLSWHYGAPGPPSRTRLTDRVITYLREQTQTDLEMHELKVLIQLAQLAPEPQAESLRELTAAAVDRIVDCEPDKWADYSAQPLMFISDPGHFLYEGLREHVEANLDYWMETQQEDGAWRLPYQWYRDEETFESLRPQITASFAVHRAITLRAFGRI